MDLFEVFICLANIIMFTLIVLLWTPIFTSGKYNPINRILVGKIELSGSNLIVTPITIMNRIDFYIDKLGKDDWEGKYYHFTKKFRLHKRVSNKNPEYICKVISHEFLHHLLDCEYNIYTCMQLDNLCTCSDTINNSGIDDW